jgi:two-component system, OmpR family, alkaline phosphatase synthesis response regulator PhoP
MTHILIVDDEQNLLDLVRGYLEREGFSVSAAHDGPSAVEAARTDEPDLVVLDLMLPGFDGLEVCRRLRQFSSAYVLMLTARTDELDRVVGLEVGADDYLGKPFSPRELVARVKAMLRRPRNNSSTLGGLPSPRRFGQLVIDASRHEITLDGTPVALTAREFALVTALAEQPGRVFTRGQLLEHAWGSGYYDEHLIDVHVANLRQKLEPDPGHPVYVETVRGVGYRFGVRESAAA